MNDYHKGMTAEGIRELVGDSPLMLEIGSHEGTDTDRFIEAMPEIVLYCFEPEQRAIQRFKAAVLHWQAVLIEKMVADVDGEKPFHPSGGKAGHMIDWDYSGSPSKPTGHLKRSPEITFKPPVMLPSIRLDTWFQTWHPETVIQFIWADVQGSQRAFIDGGQIALSRTRYLYIECHHPYPLYEDEPSREELMALLPDFEPLAFYETDNILFQNRLLT